MKRLQIVFVLWVLLLALAAPALAAQDDPAPAPLVTNTPTVAVPTIEPEPDIAPVVDEPLPDEEEPLTPDEAGEYLVRAIDTATKVAYAASLVLVVTQILKVGMTRLLPEKYWISPAMLALGVQVIFWVGHVLTNQLGYGQQYRDILQIIENVLKAFQPLLPMTIVTGLGAHAFYNVAHKSRQPGFRFEPQRKAA